MTNTTDIDAAIKAFTSYIKVPLGQIKTPHVQTILAALEHYKGSQWMPISEAPVRGNIFLHHKFFQYDCVEEGFKGSSGRFYNVKGTEVFPTHWMPLPTPPKGQDDDTE